MRWGFRGCSARSWPTALGPDEGQHDFPPFDRRGTVETGIALGPIRPDESFPLVQSQRLGVDSVSAGDFADQNVSVGPGAHRDRLPFGTRIVRTPHSSV